MPDYDFHQLSPLDLERLARDLLQVEWDIRLESFKPGRDGGIDLRYVSGLDNIIVQVKHYAHTGLSGLVRDLKKEDTKVNKLAPSRYAIVTSVPLSPMDKDKIIEALPSAPLAIDDVIGQDDLNNLLGLHPQIEKHHPKLWLTSSAVLDQVLHNAEVTRSEFEVKKIRQQIRRYVETEAFGEAEKRLSEESVVMIAGPPGIGKTTLANMLLYEHLSQGWQAVVIDRDITEGTKVFKQGVKQVFHFDDFIGATLIGEGISANDKALLSFISMVRDDPASRLILTTREHLYEQAKTRSERLRHANLDADRVILRLHNYTIRQRAQILYNHIYFSNLPSKHVEVILKNDFYQKIIRHNKFNPRIIEWMATRQRIESVPPNEYRKFVRQLLENPIEIWRHAYEQELSNAARTLLLTLWSFEGRTSVDVLENSFTEVQRYRANRYSFEYSPHDFSRALKELSGSFVAHQGQIGLRVIDPSVLDLLGTVISEAPENAVDLLVSAISFSQVARVWTFARQKEFDSLRRAITQCSREAAPNINGLMSASRRVNYANGTTAWEWPSYPERLSIILSLSTELCSPKYQDLVGPMADTLFAEPLDEGSDIAALVDIILMIERNRLAEYQALAEKLRLRVFEIVRSGCRSDELREAIQVLRQPPNQDEILALKAGFKAYREDYFFDERTNCNSFEEFDSLTSDLDHIGNTLGISMEHLIGDVEESREDFGDMIQQSADAAQDEYKERQYVERQENDSIADMFESLKGHKRS